MAPVAGSVLVRPFRLCNI